MLFVHKKQHELHFLLPVKKKQLFCGITFFAATDLSIYLTSIGVLKTLNSLIHASSRVLGVHCSKYESK